MDERNANSTGATEVPFLLGTVFHQSSLRDKDVFSGVSVDQQKACLHSPSRVPNLQQMGVRSPKGARKDHTTSHHTQNDDSFSSGSNTYPFVGLTIH